MLTANIYKSVTLLKINRFWPKVRRELCWISILVRIRLSQVRIQFVPEPAPGLGIAPQKIGKVYGIFKAYCTRVGMGPFPTELHDETGEKLRDAGHEYGSTTGRPRRCGWLDLVALKYSVMLNGATELIMMKADVLDSFETIKICVGYEIDGEVVENFPFELNDRCKTHLR